MNKEKLIRDGYKRVYNEPIAKAHVFRKGNEFKIKCVSCGVWHSEKANLQTGDSAVFKCEFCNCKIEVKIPNKQLILNVNEDDKTQMKHIKALIGDKETGIVGVN